MKFRDTMQCLNGWWDYVPAGSADKEGSVPNEGWAESRYLVPSIVDKSLAGVRKKGETYYTEHLTEDPSPFCDGEHEFLFDNHEYPVEWLAANSGWARRTVRVAPLEPGKRRFLRLDAVAGRSEIWIDGQQVSINNDAFLPNEIDVTDYLTGGNHELAVLVRDYERLPEDTKKTLAPSGNMMTSHMRGIWQDVWLFERSDVHIVDTTIRTSVRKQTLTVISEIHNASTEERTVNLQLTVAEWARGDEPFGKTPVLELPIHTVAIAAGETRTIELTVPWQEAKLWQPEAPNLYWLCSRLVEGETTRDQVAERFGFREVWIEGPDFILNGYPIHFFSDWGHKVNQLHHTEAWNRCWFAMMKRENMNHSRLHTHPHPELIMDLADEEGIFITGETGIHGSGGEQAADEAAFWEAAREHITRYIRRDKNHPSLLLWSVENEMRWNQDTSSKTKEELPKLYQLFRELDPTREAYHEGDSSLWNESEQAIMSRHYGKECGGYGWWDKQRPLHAGEMSAYHYMGPNTNFHTGEGDLLWADYQKVVEAAAWETLWIVEAGRTQGTAAFGPWNISCLCNLRMETEKVTLDYADWTTPGVKPQFIQPHTAEYAFWKEDGDRYTPFGKTNAIQAKAFRPFALIDLSHRKSYFIGQEVQRTLYLVNDTTSDQQGSLVIRLESEGKVLHVETHNLSIGRGRVVEHPVSFVLSGSEDLACARFCVTFTPDGKTAPLDLLERDWSIYPEKPARLSGQSGPIRLIGSGVAEKWLQELGLEFEQQDALEGPIESDPHLLLMERNTVVPGSQQNQWIEDYLRKGGQVLLLEQSYSLFPGVVLESKPQLHGFIRGYGHPVLADFKQDDFHFWGEEPFASMDTDAHVVHRAYQKGESSLLQPLVDAGEGGFGLKLPEWTALGEVKLGNGRLLASQFRFTDKASTIPEARKLFTAMLTYLLGEKSFAHAIGRVAEADNREDLISALNTAKLGGSAWIRLRDGAALADVSERLGVQLSCVKATRYQAVRAKEDPVLSGISNVDLCGIDSMSYCFDAESHAVATCALEHTDGLEPLLVTPTKALLEEHHIHGQRPEPIRTHSASRFLFAEAPKEQVMLGRVRHGEGYVYLDVFGKPEETHPRLKRFESVFLRYLGGSLETNALTGDKVPAPIEFSQGYPRQILTQPVSTTEQREELATNTALPAERMAPSSMFRLSGWTVIENEKGIWETDPATEQAYFTCLYTPRARRIVMEDSGIPNPESLTFLDVEAPDGSVELFLNGESMGTKSLASGKASFSDLELVQAFNQVLLLWKPESGTGPLHFRFRNIQMHPETEFIFLRANEELTNWEQAEF
ncbi:MAG: glycoside hydrolase family 2 protein [Puniceicoccaceae bacterium]